MILGITGKAQSGKDTVYQTLRNHLYPRRKVVRMAFADELKKECAKATGYSLEQLEDNKAWMRPLFQWWGTDFRRRFKDDYWIEKLAYNLKVHPDANKETLFIITDVRFINEAQLVRALGGKVWKVKRVDGSGNVVGNKDATSEHKSETEVDLIPTDTLLFNSTIKSFESEIIMAWDKLADKVYGKHK